MGTAAAAHPVIARALADGRSPPRGRELCDRSDRLPASKRDDADAILTGAARAWGRACRQRAWPWRVYQRSRPDCPDEDGGFGDRAVWLGVTLGGAGRLDGDLTRAAPRLSAVLDSQGRRPGRRMAGPRCSARHDALEEAS
jgi:hypothetical protein